MRNLCDPLCVLGKHAPDGFARGKAAPESLVDYDD